MIGQFDAALVTTVGLVLAPLCHDAAPGRTPHTMVMDGRALAATRARLVTGTASKATRTAYHLLINTAAADLKTRPTRQIATPDGSSR